MLQRLILTAALLCLSVFGADAANRFLTCNTTCTITAADTSIWGTSSGGTGASVPGSSDAVVLDAATCVGGTTCTATMGAAYNPTWQTITMGACTASTAGCILDFSANNNNITLNGVNTALSSSGTGTRTLNMGNGLWDFTGAQPSLDFTTVTNFTFNANSSTIRWSGANQAGARQFITGGKTFNIVTANASNGLVFNIATTGATIATLNVTGPNHVTFPGASTVTVTNLNVTGTVNVPVLLKSSTTGIATVGVTSASMSGVAINQLTFTGSPTATNCYDIGSNTGITCTAPASQRGIIGGGF